MIVSGIVDRTARSSTGRIDAHLGRRVMLRRQELGVTQAHLAAAMRGLYEMDKWRPATVASIESGRRNISLDELGALCMILGVTLNELAGDVTGMGGPLPNLLGQYDHSGPLLPVQTDLDALIAEQQRERLEAAVLTRATGMESWPNAAARKVVARFFVDQVASHDGHDLLTERDARVAQGQGNRTWTSRRLADEVAALPPMVWLRGWLADNLEQWASAVPMDLDTFTRDAAKSEKRGWK